MYKFTEHEGATEIGDIFSPLHESLNTTCCDEVWAAAGFKYQSASIGIEEGSEIVLYVDRDRSDYQCLLVLSIGGCDIEVYVTPTIHDAMCFLRDFGPTVHLMAQREA